ncbi:MAG TPA: carboxypeptidase-like regulatory domain-containing protein [Candidatus Aquilonibacter sp.]|nr:carboxypeptidase-like regulatory domain-containing protein [Candidatus Aquilonibacter sp.]
MPARSSHADANLAAFHTAPHLGEVAAAPVAAAVPALAHSQSTSNSAPQQQQRLPQPRPIPTGAIEGTIRDPSGQAVVGAQISLRNTGTGEVRRQTGTADGVFRMIDLPPGHYDLKVTHDGYTSYTEADIAVAAGQVLDRAIQLTPTAVTTPPLQHIPEVPQVAAAGAPPSTPPSPPGPPYPGVIQQLEEGQPPVQESVVAVPLPPAGKVFVPQPDRWAVRMPDWDRYGIGNERPYVKSHLWDPFDRNKLKGDYPVFGQQTFFDLTGVSDTFLDGRRLPTPSNVSTARPGEPGFFGKGDQLFLDQVFLFSFDLFHGDASFRPVDWRIRVTPAVSLNYLDVQEKGVVNIDVAKGTTRLDSHLGLQEAFGELKLHDLSPNFDFISVRAGIQEFNSDFRGFLFVDHQPGIRFFGNYDDNRWQYNLAYFNFLEKNTNSDLNSMALRKQQLILANVYRQDFLVPGYTAQFSVHYNIDQSSIHYDDNGFLVRPSPIGSVVSDGMIRAHAIHAVYLGWTGDGHIGRLNITHAFYQALGTDSYNPLANRPVTINAQFAAAELSIDKDWARFKISGLYASGSANPHSAHARGFDSIDDDDEFAGGIFSLWDHEGIRLTGSGVLLTSPNSLLPDLRSSKFEGQSNFVNPGIFLINAGTDLDLTPKLRAFVNLNYLQFMRTEPLELLLFQGNIRRPIGYDYSVGVRYRPPLTENFSITAGAAALTPGQGFTDIYGGKTLFSVFTDIRFQF